MSGWVPVVAEKKKTTKEGNQEGKKEEKEEAAKNADIGKIVGLVSTDAKAVAEAANTLDVSVFSMSRRLTIACVGYGYSRLDVGAHYLMFVADL